MKADYQEAKYFARRVGCNPSKKGILAVQRWMTSINAFEICDFMRLFPGTHKESMTKAENSFWQWYMNP